MAAETDERHEIRALIDYDWLVTTTWEVLHHASGLTDDQLGAMDDDGQLSGPVRLDCGRTVVFVSIPGLFSRMGKPRCKRCCRATGMPEGDGSPKNDDACRKLLGLPVEPEP